MTQVAPALILPILPAVIYDWPRDRSTVYQVGLSISIWAWCVVYVASLTFRFFISDAGDVISFCTCRHIPCLLSFSLSPASSFLCGLYTPKFSIFSCGRRDFLTMF